MKKGESNRKSNTLRTVLRYLFLEDELSCIRFHICLLKLTAKEGVTQHAVGYSEN